MKSTARLFADKTRGWLRGFLVLTLALMGLAVIVALRGQTAPLKLVVALGGVWAFGWHMALQLKSLDLDEPASCLRAFRANRDAGLIPALFLAVAAWL